MIVIDRNALRTLELAWSVTFLAELGHERAAIITREYLHSIIPAISDEQETSMMVERQASRKVEHAISLAMLKGADRELDSSITIKSSLFHLFLFNLSYTHNDKEMFQAPNCSNQRDEDMKLSHTRDTRHETRGTTQETPSKQRSNKKQQEPIDEGTKNSTIMCVCVRVLALVTSIPQRPHDHHPLTHCFYRLLHQ